MRSAELASCETVAKAVVKLAREQWPVVSLYVNDYNGRAVRLYERVGFVTGSTFATVLY